MNKKKLNLYLISIENLLNKNYKKKNGWTTLIRKDMKEVMTQTSLFKEHKVFP